MMPKVSVIIPCYNHGHYIAETIDSVLAQDYENFEVIVGDDASTDNSAEIIKSYGKRIRSFFYKENRGCCATLVELFKQARGDYVQMLGSDDLYLPGFLSNAMKLMQEHNLKLCCCNIRYFKSADDYKETNLYATNMPVAFHRNQVVSIFQKSDFWVPGVCCITEIETLRKYGLPNPRLENISDWFLFNRIAVAEGVGFVPQVGVAMRVIEGAFGVSVKKCRKRRNATYFAALELIENDPARLRLRDSGIMSVIFENLFWKLIYRPKWWGFFKYSKFSVKERFLKSLKKRWSKVCHQNPS